MPNSYSVVPNVLPGNVTIGGNLTLLGDQLQLGTGTSKVRLWNSPNNALVLSYNLGFDNNTQDDAARDSCEYELFSSGQRLAARWKASAGNVQAGAFTLPVLTDYTQHVHTGTVTEDTIYSKVIRGGIIGANGGLKIHAMMDSTVQGAPATTFRFKLGATVLFSTTIAALTNFIWDLYLVNRNAQNSQQIHGGSSNIGTGAQTLTFGTSAIDTSVDQTFSITTQNGTATDSQNWEMAIVELLNSFGPV